MQCVNLANYLAAGWFVTVSLELFLGKIAREKVTTSPTPVLYLQPPKLGKNATPNPDAIYSFQAVQTPPQCCSP